MSAKLLPCPFCGVEAAVYCETSVWWVRCENCQAESGSTDTEEGAAEVWNTRSKPVAGVEVKPLEWGSKHEDATGYLSYDAKSVLGTYSIYRIKNGGVWSCERGVVNIGQFSSETEAKAAAEADYRQRILSTLSCSEQEPVAWARYAEDGDLLELLHNKERAGALMSFGKDVRPLYASPQPEAVITEERVERFCIDRFGEEVWTNEWSEGRRMIERRQTWHALEAAMKEA